MGIDLKAIKRRQEQLNRKGSASSVSKDIYKLQEGPQKLRIVPLKANPSNPFIELQFYYPKGRTILSPMSLGQPDPIREFGRELLEGPRREPEEFKAIMNTYFPKLRTFVPVIVRGKESEGVKFWGFGKTVVDKIISILEDEEYGDITDPESGTDLTVVYTKGTQTTFAKTDITAARKSSPLTTDKELLKTLLNTQPNLLESYEQLSYDELKNDILPLLVNPWDATPSSTTPTASTDESETSVASDEPSDSDAATTTDDIDEDVKAQFKQLFNK